MEKQTKLQATLMLAELTAAAVHGRVAVPAGGGGRKEAPGT